MGSVIIGAKIGQRHERTGIAVVEREQRGDVWHFTARHLERLPAGKPYPESAGRLAAVTEGARAQAIQRLPVHQTTMLNADEQRYYRRSEERHAVTVYADVTGLGDPVIRLLAASGVEATPVYFTHGDRREKMENGGGVLLGKGWLVAELQVLLQTGRLHLPETKDAATLAKELTEYEIKMEPDANERYGAFAVGSQDELVTALGLTVQAEIRTPWRAY